MASRTHAASASRFTVFERDDWARLGAGNTLLLSEPDLPALGSLDEAVTLDEVTEIYLPLVRLLNLRIRAAREMDASTRSFLRMPPSPCPT